MSSEVPAGDSAGAGAGAGASDPELSGLAMVEMLNKSVADGVDISSAEFAADLDSKDPLRSFRDQFLIPHTEDSAKIRTPGSPCVYLCGNSLGLQPKGAKEAVAEEMTKWEERGVTGHFTTERPWVSIDETVYQEMARVVGGLPVEVVCMNTLTANLHFLMVPFYRPTKERYKILMEAKSFPSDFFAITSQLHFHGIDPKDGLIEVAPREGESFIRTEDIEAVLAGEEGSKIALVLFSGVQYYTGQAFEIERITKAAHAAGAIAGFDCAHAAGNIDLKLHDWNVDFAVWCTYKYLNSGPGCTGGAFVHERHATDTERPRFAGWWGTDKTNRFKMEHDFRPTPGAFGYQVSNPSVLPLATMRASLDLFESAGMDKLRSKALGLTRYLELLVQKHLAEFVTILTPSDMSQRGCQLSLEFSLDLHTVHKRLDSESIIVDVREPSAMRVAPAPMYNSFSDVAEFVRVLTTVLLEEAKK